MAQPRSSLIPTAENKFCKTPSYPYHPFKYSCLEWYLNHFVLFLTFCWHKNTSFQVFRIGAEPPSTYTLSDVQRMGEDPQFKSRLARRTHQCLVWVLSPKNCPGPAVQARGSGDLHGLKSMLSSKFIDLNGYWIELIEIVLFCFVLVQSCAHSLSTLPPLVRFPLENKPPAHLAPVAVINQRLAPPLMLIIC